MVDGFKSVKNNFEADAGFDLEPVKLLQDESDVIIGAGLDLDTGSRLVNHL